MTPDVEQATPHEQEPEGQPEPEPTPGDTSVEEHAEPEDPDREGHMSEP